MGDESDVGRSISYGDYDDVDENGVVSGMANATQYVEAFDDDDTEGADQLLNSTTKRNKAKPIAASKDLNRTWMWTHDQIMKVISLWQTEECLYRSSSPDYRDKNKRMEAFERIRSAMESEESPGPSVNDIMTKMNSLKVYHTFIRSKQEASVRNGKSVHEIPPVKWPYFRYLNFLNEHVTPRKVFPNMMPTQQHPNADINFINYNMAPRKVFPNLHPAGPEINFFAESVTAPRKMFPNININPNVDGSFDVRETNTTGTAPGTKRKVVHTVGDDESGGNEVLVTATKSGRTDADNSAASPSRHPDDVFCEMLGIQLRKVREGMVKEKLKMDVQRLVFNVLYPETSPMTAVGPPVAQPPFTAIPAGNTQYTSESPIPSLNRSSVGFNSPVGSPTYVGCSSFNTIKEEHSSSWTTL